MKRRIFTILSALSLLLCVVLARQWVRTYRYGDQVLSYYGDHNMVGVFSVQGTLKCVMIRLQDPSEVDKARHHPEQMGMVSQMMFEHDSGGRFLGFAWELMPTDPYGETDIGLAIPHWFVVGLSMILPVLWLRRWRRIRLAKRRGLCPICGYDLRATPDRCPECGTPIPVKAVSGSGRT